MRLRSLILAVLILPGLCAAQDDASSDDTIHAVTVMHEDGSKTVTVTDPAKHTSEASTYDSRERLLKKIVYALDDQNQLVSGVVYTPAGKPAFKSVYKRDQFNRITEEDDYTMDDQIIGRFVYEFGNNGRLVRIHAYDAQGNEIEQSQGHRDQQQSLPRVH